MKNILLCLAVIGVASPVFSKVTKKRINNLVVENIPDIPHELQERLAPYLDVRYASFRDWLPDDTGMLIRTRLGEVSQIHLVETPKGARQQLTFSAEPLDVATVCPDEKNPYFLFTRDSAGNEVDQIYKYHYLKKTSELLTDGISKHGSVRWSNSGHMFAFRSNMRNGKDYDIYIGTLDGKRSFQPVLQEGGYWYTADFSPDDKYLITGRYISSSESKLYVLDLASRALDEINPSEVKISYGTARWARNGKGIYMISDERSDFRQLVYYDRTTHAATVLTTQIPWDIEEFEISPSGDTIALVANEEGSSRLYFMNTSTRQLTQAKLPSGLIYNITYKPDGSTIAMVINTPKSPSDVYTLNLKNKSFTRWTYSEIAGIDTNSFSVPELIHYPTFDSIDTESRKIPAYYYKPRNHKPPYPVLIQCHGGPASQSILGFSPITQFYVNELGIAVIEPNIRGSSGYGKTYQELDNKYKRHDAIADIGALLDWIEAQPELDARRVGIEGGSYGGYVVLASMAQYGSRLKCGVSSVGISSFVTFLENTGSYRRDIRRAEYGDESDPKMRDFLITISPLTNAHRIERPLFIAQGLNDPRVPATEAEQIVKAVRKNDVDVWYLLAEDEGHGFGKKSNRNYYQQAKVLFLKNYLLH